MIASGTWKPLGSQVPFSYNDHLKWVMLKNSRRINVNMYIKLRDSPQYTQGNMVGYQPECCGESRQHWKFL